MKKIIILVTILFLGCHQNPTGPTIPEESQLAVFCVLNPTVRTQTLIVNRTYSFCEVTDQLAADVTAKNATIKVLGPDGELDVINMPPGYSNIQKDSIQTRLDTDFLSGTSGFNYLLPSQAITAGAEYKLTITSNEYETITARTKIPGPFQLSEFDFAPEWNDAFYNYETIPEDEYFHPPSLFHVAWTPSEGAAGYLVDITALEYDIPTEIQHGDLVQIGEFNYMTFDPPNWPDSSQIVHAPYREIPVDFNPYSPDRYVRGKLTRDLEINIPRYMLFKMVSFPGDFQYRKQHVKRFRVYVHAVDEPLYNYLAFQYAQIGKEKIVGQEIAIPDISNVQNGVGIWGAANTCFATSRLIHRIVQTEGEYLPWDPSHEESNKDEIYGSFRFNYNPWLPLPYGNNFTPDDDYILQPDNTVRLSWDEADYASYYLLVLKPYYLWFHPGNFTYLLKDPYFDISWNDFPFRDCEIEWYVKTLTDNTYPWWMPYSVVALSDQKDPLVMSNSAEMGWSKSHYITIASGKIAGFEGQQPQVNTPQDGSQMTLDDRLQWSEIHGADAYLLYIQSEEGQTIIACAQTNSASPPFPDQRDEINGVIGLDKWQSGMSYSWQVCALRVMTGAFGFSVVQQSNGLLPQIYPRYEHPSGIVQQSRWSGQHNFDIE